MPLKTPSLPVAIWRFICAVVKHWVSLMTGGILALALVLYERTTGADVPLSVYWVIAAFTVVAATFLAWWDEYLGRERAAKQLDDRESRRRIRTELATLMSDGQTLVDRYDKAQRPTEQEVLQWADSVERYLRANLDESFVPRFRDQSVDDGLYRVGPAAESKRWTFLRWRVANLGKFIEELH
jgi:hypothetical protein